MIAVQRLTRLKMRKLPCPVAKRNLSTTPKDITNSAPTFRPPLISTKRMKQIGAVGLGLGATQYAFGNADTFFEHKFITNKKPMDLADFYGTEDFMELFCVFPFMVSFMIRNAAFDDDGTIHAFGLLGPGELEIHIDFSEEEKDGELSWFNKKESFRDHAPAFLGGFKLWEMTQNFGYHLKDDGTCEVYHHGASFSGFFPMRLVFYLHSCYTIWATEKYVNGDEFGMEDTETDLEVQRQNIPLHVFKHFVDGLTRDLEKAKEVGASSPQEQERIEVTLQRLKTISSAKDEGTTLSRMQTLRSRKTNLRTAHLIIDDKETKETIKTAMEQIHSSSGKRHEPLEELVKLARHATTVAQQNQRPVE
jgi:hypothetical protein